VSKLLGKRSASEALGPDDEENYDWSEIESLLKMRHQILQKRTQAAKLRLFSFVTHNFKNAFFWHKVFIFHTTFPYLLHSLFAKLFHLLYQTSILK
jgi:hypothetical protein